MIWFINQFIEVDYLEEATPQEIEILRRNNNLFDSEEDAITTRNIVKFVLRGIKEELKERNEKP